MASDKELREGMRVRSVAIGRKAAFFGTVIERAAGGWNVRDDDEGRLWLRSASELTIIREQHQIAAE